VEILGISVPEKVMRVFSSNEPVHIWMLPASWYVHAHPPYAVAASLVVDEVVPEDSEGEILCPKIPVVQGVPGSQEIADKVTRALSSSKVVIARGHGTFAAGKTLDDAYVHTSVAEHSCRILILKHSLFQQTPE
jgi:L-fuculose-phosphate aldolase